jgi:carbon monoxide dehydrogenase subunit G
MPALHSTIHIDSPSETVFVLTADLPQYDRWLPRSRAFDAVTQVSHVPVGLGTTYVNTGPSGAIHGSITDYHLPARIAFRQSMRIKLLLFAGTLDMHIRYTLEPAGHATRVDKDVAFDTHGVLKAVQPIIVTTIRWESKRLLQVMKRYVETLPENDDR